jgi:hypothetical protein
VVGLGTQDDFAYAQRFRERTGVTHRLLWDPGFDSWAALRIASQPAAVLLAPDGSELRRWGGIFDESEVLAAVAGVGGAALSAAAPSTGGEPTALNRFCRYAERFDRAQRQLEEAAGSDDLALTARVGDDVVFAANGLDQFGPPELRPATIALAEAAYELRRDLAGPKPWRADALERYRGAARTMVDPLQAACGMTLTLPALG